MDGSCRKIGVSGDGSVQEGARRQGSDQRRARSLFSDSSDEEYDSSGWGVSSRKFWEHQYAERAAWEADDDGTAWQKMKVEYRDAADRRKEKMEWKEIRAKGRRQKVKKRRKERRKNEYVQEEQGKKYARLGTGEGKVCGFGQSCRFGESCRGVHSAAEVRFFRAKELMHQMVYRSSCRYCEAGSCRYGKECYRFTGRDGGCVNVNEEGALVTALQGIFGCGWKQGEAVCVPCGEAGTKEAETGGGFEGGGGACDGEDSQDTECGDSGYDDGDEAVEGAGDTGGQGGGMRTRMQGVRKKKKAKVATKKSQVRGWDTVEEAEAALLKEEMEMRELRESMGLRSGGAWGVSSRWGAEAVLTKKKAVRVSDMGEEEAVEVMEAEEGVSTCGKGAGLAEEGVGPTAVAGTGVDGAQVEMGVEGAEEVVQKNGWGDAGIDMSETEGSESSSVLSEMSATVREIHRLWEDEWDGRSIVRGEEEKFCDQMDARMREWAEGLGTVELQEVHKKLGGNSRKFLRAVELQVFGEVWGVVVDYAYELMGWEGEVTVERGEEWLEGEARLIADEGERYPFIGDEFAADDRKRKLLWLWFRQVHRKESDKGWWCWR